MQLSKKEYPVYTFSSFSESMAQDAFGLTIQLEEKGFLDEWLANAKAVDISTEEDKNLKKLQRKLRIKVRFWNEQELRERFIIPVSELVDFDMEDVQISAFSEREMKIVYKQSIIKGKVEWMVAKGSLEPKHPFFFIHEYKKEKKESKSDAIGQLLATLSVAKLLNEQTPKLSLFNPSPTNFAHIPLYGCYILGRFWFFVRLKDQQYYISNAYDSTQEKDLHFIFKMLKAQKQMIRELLI